MLLLYTVQIFSTFCEGHYGCHMVHMGLSPTLEAPAVAVTAVVTSSCCDHHETRTKLVLLKCVQVVQTKYQSAAVPPVALNT